MRISPRDVLVAAGTFLLVSAVLAHVVVSGRFATTVPSSSATTRSTATGATILDTTTGRVDTDVRLDRRRIVRLAEPPAPGLDAYVVSTSIQRADGTFVSRQRWSAVQQPVSGRAIVSPFNTEQVTRFDANGNTVEVREPLRTLGGVVLRFSRDTEPVDQPRWDPSTGTVATARFVGRTTLADREVFEFRQRGVGRSSGTAGGVEAVSRTTLWIRPETGDVVKEATHLLTRLPDGRVALDATFVDIPQDVRAASTRVDNAVQRRTWAAVVAPAVILVLGMLALVAAGFEGSSGRLTGRSRIGRPMEGQ